MSEPHDKASRPQPGRRGLLKGAAAAAGLAAGSGLVTGFPTLWAQKLKDVKITHVGQSYSTIQNIAKQASADLGFTVEMQTVDSATQVNRLLSQPQTIDIADFGPTNMKYFLGRGLFMPIELSRYKYWDKTAPLFTKGTYPSGKESSLEGYAPIKTMYYTGKDAKAYSRTPTEWVSGVPVYFNADTLGLRTDLVERKVESWADLLSPDFKGRVALNDNWSVGVMDAAMALAAKGDVQYKDKGDMTRDEIDRTVAKLIEYKRAGHFRSFWTNFDQSVQLMASGEVVLQSMWAPAVTEVRTRNIACYYTPLKEGYRGWSINLYALNHLEGLKRDAAYEYLNWYNSGWSGAFISRQGFYSAVPDTAKGQMTLAEWDYWYEGKPAAEDIKNPFGKTMEKAGVKRDGGALWDRMGNIGIWNTVMTEDRYLVRKWNEFIAA
jgi:putative spermidine/putrescine transport system substrate-binding protein